MLAIGWIVIIGGDIVVRGASFLCRTLSIARPRGWVCGVRARGRDGAGQGSRFETTLHLGHGGALWASTRVGHTAGDDTHTKLRGTGDTVANSTDLRGSAFGRIESTFATMLRVPKSAAAYHHRRGSRSRRRRARRRRPAARRRRAPPSWPSWSPPHCRWRARASPSERSPF